MAVELAHAEGGLLDPSRLATHRVTSDQLGEAYERFANVGATRALEVVRSRP